MTHSVCCVMGAQVNGAAAMMREIDIKDAVFSRAGADRDVVPMECAGNFEFSVSKAQFAIPFPETPAQFAPIGTFLACQADEVFSQAHGVLGLPGHGSSAQNICAKVSPMSSHTCHLCVRSVQPASRNKRKLLHLSTPAKTLFIQGFIAMNTFENACSVCLLGGHTREIGVRITRERKCSRRTR